MDYKQILRALLADVYKMPETEIDSLLNESADQAVTQSAIFAKDSERVETIKKPFIGKFDEGKKAGTKEGLTNLEKTVKEKFGFDSDLQGVELIDALVAAKTESSSKTKTLTDDDVKRHPVYQGLEKKARDEKKAVEESLNKQIEDLQNGFKRKETLGEIKKKVVSIFESLNPVLPGNPQVASTVKNNFLATFDAYDYDVQEDGRIIPLKDGKVLEDKHGNTVDFESIVKETASNWFEFQQNNGGSNGGNGKPGENKGGNVGNGGSTGPIKTLEDLAKYARDENIPIEQRDKAIADWDAAHPSGTN